MDCKDKKNKFSKNREHMIFRLCFYYVVCIRYYLDHWKKVLGCAWKLFHLWVPYFRKLLSTGVLQKVVSCIKSFHKLRKKLPASESLFQQNLLKKRLQRRCCPKNFAKFSWAPIFQKIYRRLPAQITELPNLRKFCNFLH